MYRETAKQLAIAMYEDALNVYERDDIAFMAPCVGKMYMDIRRIV